MRIGIDDTDSPAGMCTTYLGAVLARRFEASGIEVTASLLVRLNPNVIYKTRGNAAICIEAEGDPDRGFELACELVEELADFACEATNPGVVVSEYPLPASFYMKAVRDFCEIDEAVSLLDRSGALYRGYKNRRGLIGAAAAVAATCGDMTYELLAYREPGRWGTPRQVDRMSLFVAEEHTWPHTWDSVDRENDVVVCVPHTPDPVLFGIRGASQAWVERARAYVQSEETGIEQVFLTNQGTDAHLRRGTVGSLQEGCSYLVDGTVVSLPRTGKGGHVWFSLGDTGKTVSCMAYEPTKGFRDIVRQLCPGDEVTVAGSYKTGSINLEKLLVRSVIPVSLKRPPICSACGKRMTSAGTGKGYKCRNCSARSREAEVHHPERLLQKGWYEVPPSARRHLAKPLCRGPPVLHQPGGTHL
jgi:tRNA(Ile2)-agmatinylcytidine synthase